MERFLSGRRNVLLVLSLLIFMGLATRASIFQASPLSGDTYQMMFMGKSFLARGEFYEMDGTVSDHFSPLYPLVLGLFCSIFGYSVDSVHVLQMLLFIALMIVTYLSIAALFGRKVGILASALLCIDPMVFSAMGSGKEDLLVMMFVIMTLYGIIKGLGNSWWMVVAGLFAGLAFLTKASTGYLFILGGVCGFLWRFYYMRFKLFLEKGYLTAALLFFSVVGLWSLRNLHQIGSINTSEHTTKAFLSMLSNPGPAMLPFLLIGLVLLLYFLERVALLPDITYFARNALKDQRYGAIFLFFGTTFIISLVSAVSLSLYEDRGPAFYRVYLRYIGVLDPIVFLLMAMSFERSGLWERFNWRKAGCFAVVLGLMFLPIPFTANNVTTFVTLPGDGDHSELIDELRGMEGDHPIYTSRTDLYFHLPENATAVINSYEEIPPGAVFVEYRVPGMTPLIKAGPGDQPIDSELGIYRKGA